jgi:prolyl 3-hydroxylase /prolyl 3,4-dihydroxylase
MNSSLEVFLFEDYLLCHDDDIHGTVEGRRIAFIYYLVPEDWSETDGGMLDLFATDGRSFRSVVTLESGDLLSDLR